ncbi:hypothetical protein BJX65DRAFT_283442 [Aspergillus insuetus]
MTIWEVATGEVRPELPGQETEVVNIASSQDGTILVSVSSDGSILLWATLPWTLSRAIRLENLSSTSLCSIDFSSDCKIVVFGVQTGGWGVWQLSTSSTEKHDQSPPGLP